MGSRPLQDALRVLGVRMFVNKDPCTGEPGRIDQRSVREPVHEDGIARANQRRHHTEIRLIPRRK